ncbi:matrix metallo ase-11 [Fusarium longipes]|uniref:Matrix metallo ase-11 n=1 Tax=Fusarium longipes TaxID=694270 RepID=A0A395SWY2_9HYPO|nr:matrix metallo ase-11 [Fusarium longipes]
MGTVQPTSPITKYPCHTQEEEDPSYGPAPISNLAGTTGDNAPDQPDSIVVGYGEIVPRWDVQTSGARTLEYFVDTETFPSPDLAKTSAKEFQAAADSWNELDLGISISETSDPINANFYLVYKVNKLRSEMGTLARAFFPHEINEDVIVYSRAFESDSLPILKNIFQHEIGHILGLRHEFAIEQEGEGAVLFMERNPNSVMSYNFPPKIRDTDRNQITEFYKLANGYMINGSPVTDFQPQIRRRRD